MGKAFKASRKGGMMKVFLSSASAVRLGLLSQKTRVLPETVYMMTGERCHASCAFCPQSLSKEKLSRVIWHPYDLEEIVSRLKGAERVCIQTTSHPGIAEELSLILASMSSLKISLSIRPLTKERLEHLEGKIDCVSINLDCATERLFGKMKDGCGWEETWQSLKDAVSIFGKNRVFSHLIVGLGETEEEMISCMQLLYDGGILPSLFAFTPLKNTPLEKMTKPPIATYRRMQLARFLIVNGLAHAKDMRFENGKVISFGQDISEIKKNPRVYLTAGCSHCDRPYYTETVRQPYNFPRMPSEEEMRQILREY